MTLLPPKVLATDLDGTLIPLPGRTENVRDLVALERACRDENVPLVFVTGRHLELTLEAIQQHGLPTPSVLIADVGTSVYRWANNKWSVAEPYVDRLSAIAPEPSFVELRNWCSEIEGLRLQEEEKQGRFKTSYYVSELRLSELANLVRAQLADRKGSYSLIESIDPFTKDGLIDIVPAGVSKAFAIDWWRTSQKLAAEEVVFSGDSGNDAAALTAGYRAIVVGNAGSELKTHVQTRHEENGWEGRLHCAKSHATSGVLEGCIAFGLLRHRPPLGATVDELGTTFSVWAPNATSAWVECVSEENRTRTELTPSLNGVFSTSIDTIRAGSTYCYRLNDGNPRPDPRSRFQPGGVHSYSQVVDPTTYEWTDGNWNGINPADLVIYELHIGTFTEAGTYAAATERLAELVELGITAIELMPVAACPGRWNWGYDGVALFAPTANYGTPDELRAFVDAAHDSGLAVILDVVYNHLGPEGNYLSEFGPYFSNRHQTPWGEGLNFDSANSEQVRDLFVDNAIFWLDEYHFDGLRLDAVHAISDDSRRSILADIRRAITSYESVCQRKIHLIAETNLYDPALLAPSDPAISSYDAIWCDDLMHAVHSQLASEARHTQRAYLGATDIGECLDRGYLYSGPPEKRAVDGAQAVQRESLIVALQNHDIVGNDPHGRRFHHLTSVDAQLAAAALFLLSPSIPLLFMGEESSCHERFHFFADFEDPHLRKAVEQGRANEYPAIAGAATLSPTSDKAFHSSKMQSGRSSIESQQTLNWYRRLLKIRREWRQLGLLDSDHLTVAHNSALGIFSLSYRQPNGQRVFVTVRLSNGKADIAIPVQGTITANSIADQSEIDVGNGTLSFSPNHAVVGTGRVVIPTG